MRLSNPRLPPLEQSEWSPEQIELLQSKSAGERVVKNIYKTLIRHPEARRAFTPWSTYILRRSNTLTPRDREILILRTGYLCCSGYEWAQHTPLAERVGLTDCEITQIKEGLAALDWTDRDRALIRAADELHSEQFISDEAWSALCRFFDEKQRMDVVFTVGEYTLVSMFLNSFGVQLESGQQLDPDLKGF